MSDTIRELLKLRQSGIPAGVIDLDLANALAGLYASSFARQDAASPIPVGQELIQSLYEPLSGNSISSQILDQYRNDAVRTIQNDIGKGDTGRLMRPMISSVMQLDR